MPHLFSSRGGGVSDAKRHHHAHHQHHQQRPPQASSNSSKPQHWARTRENEKAIKQDEKHHQPKAATVAAAPTQQVWRSAVDSKTGRTYYYDIVTRQTQWRKPLDLATDEERKAIEQKERKQKEFFAAMESNILKSLAGGHLVPRSGNTSSSCEDSSGSGDEDDRGEDKIAEMKTTTSTSGSRSSLPSSASDSNDAPKGLLPKALKPNQKPVRTISSMDDALIAELAKTGQKVESPFDTMSTKVKVSPTSVVSTSYTYPFDGDGGGISVPGGSAEDKTPLASHLNALFPPPTKQSSSLTGTSSPSNSEDDHAVDEFRRTAEEMAAMTLDGVDGDGPVLENEDVSSATPKPSLEQLKSIPKPILGQQRNTCGTLHVSTTMSDPDKDATIKCICGIYRAHIVQAAHEEAASGFRPQVKFDEYEIFNDLRSERGSGGSPKRISASAAFEDSRDEPPLSDGTDPSIEAYTSDSIESCVPSLDEITAFYSDVFRRSQMETDCIIMSLIYIERLIKVTVGGVRPRIGNWRSMLFASMVMSSKVWDDLSMWNADFSQTCPSGVRFPLKRINELELAMLNCLKFDVKVKASEYAKYYFLIRSMCIRSGLAGHDLIHSKALDIESAKKIEDISSKFHRKATRSASPASGNPSSALPVPVTIVNRRTKSTGEVEKTSSPTSSPAGVKVHLENIIQM